MKVKNKCYIAGVFLVTLLIAVTHRNQFARFLVGFELLLFAVLFFQARYLGKQMQAQLLIPEPFAGKDEEVKINVKLRNPGWMPVPEIRVKLSVEDRFAKKTTQLTGSAMLDSRGEAVLGFRITSAYCGAIAFHLEEVEVRDYLGIFSSRMELTGQTQEISVIPGRAEEIRFPGVGQQTFAGEEARDSGSRAGDDPSEIYDIRAFRQGDTIHRIHWNMSAKMDELLVRDLGEQEEQMTVLLLDLRSRGNFSRNDWEIFLEHVAAMSGKLLEEACGHYVVWLDAASGELIRMQVEQEEEYRVMLAALVRAVPYENGQIETYYKEKFGDETLKEVIRISLAGEIVRER
ncbi:MAG: DUF58 domain-containing protein [Lachnoclostridium sp.]|nr:DUF58 domain-containing protein [Lachnoclostridium sp.]